MPHFKLPQLVAKPMAQEVEVKLDLIPELKAKQYLKQILTAPRGKPVNVTVPWGKSARVIARVRTELSRLRGELKGAKREIRLFKLLVTDIQYGTNAEQGDVITFLVNDDANAVKHELSDLAALIVDEEKR